MPTVQLEIAEPFAFITMDRPNVRNTMNQEMITELTQAFLSLRDNRNIRGIVLTGEGGNFCAGEDVKEMQTAYSHPDYDGTVRARNFDRLMMTINTAPQVVVARVEGAAMADGIGLICVSDVAIASEDTIFTLPETRMGTIPALLMPYLIQRVGLTTARRLMLIGARFDGIEAVRHGLVHEYAPLGSLDDYVDGTLRDILECSPAAIAACKQLMFKVTVPAEERDGILSDLRKSKEGQEGMLAFIQKRKPDWAK